MPWGTRHIQRDDSKRPTASWPHPANFPDTRGCVRTVSVPTENGVFNQLTMSLCFLTAISGNPQLRTATSMHIDLVSDQPCGLAVTWTVHFLQRQSATTMDSLFLQGAAVATKWSVRLYRQLTVSMDCVSLLMPTALHMLPRTIDCVFLQGATDAPVAANYGLPFCRWPMASLHHAHLWTFVKENANQWLGAVSVANGSPRILQTLLCFNACRCLLVVKIQVQVLRFAGVCYGAQRRLFLRLCLTASSCASGDQYFNTCNSLRPTSVIHSLNAALKSNINGLPWWTLLQ